MISPVSRHSEGSRMNRGENLMPFTGSLRRIARRSLPPENPVPQNHGRVEQTWSVAGTTIVATCISCGIIRGELVPTRKSTKKAVQRAKEYLLEHACRTRQP